MVVMRSGLLGLKRLIGYRDHGLDANHPMSVNVYVNVQQLAQPFETAVFKLYLPIAPGFLTSAKFIHLKKQRSEAIETTVAL